MPNAICPPWHSGDMETVWVLHLYPKQTYSVHRPISPLLQLNGAVPLEKGEGREKAFT